MGFSWVREQRLALSHRTPLRKRSATTGRRPGQNEVPLSFFLRGTFSGEELSDWNPGIPAEGPAAPGPEAAAKAHAPGQGQAQSSQHITGGPSKSANITGGR